MKKPIDQITHNAGRKNKRQNGIRLKAADVRRILAKIARHPVASLPVYRPKFKDHKPPEHIQKHIYWNAVNRRLRKQARNLEIARRGGFHEHG